MKRTMYKFAAPAYLKNANAVDKLFTTIGKQMKEIFITKGLWDDLVQANRLALLPGYLGEHLKEQFLRDMVPYGYITMTRRMTFGSSGVYQVLIAIPKDVYIKWLQEHL